MADNNKIDPDLANLPKLNPVPATHKVLSVRPNQVYDLNTLAADAINLLASIPLMNFGNSGNRCSGSPR